MIILYALCNLNTCLLLLVILKSFSTLQYLLYRRKKTSRNPRFRLWTFPVIVDGPFGVVSAAEFIGILLFVVYVIWAIIAYTLRALRAVSDDRLSFKEQRYIILCFFS